LCEWAEPKVERIIILDNVSTWDPLLDWYRTCHYEVRMLQGNFLKHAPWKCGVLGEIKTDYIISDPDVIPLPTCPEDLIEVLQAGCHKYDKLKVGVSLTVGDGASQYIKKAKSWSMSPNISGKPIPNSPYRMCWGVDTTFAVYNGKLPKRYGTTPALRTMPPYLAEHEGWHLDPENLSDELRHYYSRAQNKLGFAFRVGNIDQYLKR
jgi:hypothetical protein